MKEWLENKLIKLDRLIEIYQLDEYKIYYEGQRDIVIELLAHINDTES